MGAGAGISRSAGCGLLVAAALLLTLPAAAQLGPEPDDAGCGKAVTTIDIVECLNELAHEWDRRLNAAYRKLLENEPAEQALRGAQRAWVAYRDANCHYRGSGEGTIKRIEAADCLRTMTAQRARELEELLKHR